MKKYLLLLPALIYLAGCSTKFDGVINTPPSDIQIVNAAKFDTVFYNTSDSMIVINAQLKFTTAPDEVFAKLKNTAGKVYYSNIRLSDNGLAADGDAVKGDKIYSGKVLMSQTIPSGDYFFEYFAVTGTGTGKLTVNNFTYNNGLQNQPPVLSDLSAPDSIEVTTDQAFLMFLTASDPNGLQDISRVYFVSTRPDGTSSGNAFLLYDDGNLQEHGDAAAGDGIYSIIVRVNASNQKGLYKFEFRAEDRVRAQSNLITKFILIK